MNVVSKTKDKPAKKTKRDQLIALLGRKHSPTLEDLSVALGWQTHTTRAAISRLRSAGLKVETVRGVSAHQTRYRLPHKEAVIETHAEASIG